MRTQIALLLALSLVFSTAGYAANAQTMQFADHVVINEVEINPPGDDSQTISEWIEIHNPTSESVDLSGWQIASTALKKTLTIPAGTAIKSGQFLTYSYQPLWFADVSESVELRNADGDVVDKTPPVTDRSGNLDSWQRIYDGLDSDSDSDWSLETPSPGSTNGKVESSDEPEPVTVTVESEKSSYLFGETATLAGRVSQKVFVEKPNFSPETIRITISGPDYYDTITQYPDVHLGYSASVNLQQVLGINEGVYDVTVDYAGSVDTAQFSVGHAITEPEEKDDAVLSIMTDSQTYMPGQTAIITASTTEEVLFEGLKFTVEDPNGELVSGGTLFPSSDVNTHGVFGSGAGTQFVTNLFVDNVSPVFGEYRIVGQYSGQVAEAFFHVAADIKEDSIVSLSTDKSVYEPGETVVISGRSNLYHVPTLSLEVVNSANLALDTAGGTGMKILDAVRLEGDSTFTYEIPIPENSASFGEYLVTVRGEIGTFVTAFSVVPDAGSFAAADEPFFVTADKEIYNIGEPMHISGMIQDQAGRSSLETPVEITIAYDAGESSTIVGLPGGSRAGMSGGADVDVTFTSIPDAAGNFAADTPITRAFFEEGAYKVTAKHGRLTATASIVVVDPVNIGSTEIVALLDKDVYGLSDTLSLSGTFGSQVTDSQGVVITLHKPNGDTDKFGTTIDGGFFSWTWQTPTSEVASESLNERVLPQSNLGIYRISLETGGNHADLFFKVSSDPEGDSLGLEPITVTADKAVYQPGDRLRVSGHVVERASGSEGSVIPDLVHIRVSSNEFPFRTIFEANVYPQQGGQYSSAFDLPATLFLEGDYKVRAVYNNERADTFFSVASDFTFGTDAPVELVLNLEKQTYHPGESVVLTGKPNKIIHIEKFDVSIIKESDLHVDCGSFYCGKHAGPITSLRPNPSAGFEYAYDIPESDSLGSYEITVDVGFDAKSVTFDVVERPAVQPPRIIDKVNRIAESEITITPGNKTSDGHDLAPRVISGSLLIPARGEESSVNLQIVSPDGVCIIGQAEGCLVSDSTRIPGSIHAVVEFGGSDYKVRYSGPDAVFEKFSILPVQDDAELPMEPFGVSVIKGEQASRFYYKITYIPVE